MAPVATARPFPGAGLTSSPAAWFRTDPDPSPASPVLAPPRRRPPSPALDTVRLADGRRVVVRTPTPGDAAGEQRLLDGLSLEARYQRFHAPVRRLAPDLLARWLRLDARQHVLVAEPMAAPWGLRLDDGEEDGPVLVADARWVRAADGDDRAEFALVVADGWQRAGLGVALVARLAAHARAHGVRTLVGDVLWDNRAMPALLRSVGGGFAGTAGDPRVRRAVIDLA